MTPPPRARRREEPTLPFDTTQEIDPAFAEILGRPAEPTLTDADFAELAPEFVPTHR
jgi:hypothetical protein